MTMPIAFVHGIESDGSKSTDLLMKCIADKGFEVLELDYGRVHFWNARFRSIQLDRAQTIVDRTHDGYHVVGHSFAGVVIRRAQQLNRKFGHVFLFSPADEEDTYYPPEGAESITIVYNRFDNAVGWGAKLPWHDFGRLGQIGYKGPDDERVKDIQDPYYSLHDSTHRHYFQKVRVEAWAKFIIDKISIIEPINPPVMYAGLPYFPKGNT